MANRIRITMVAPKREKCGVADYTQYLLNELRERVDVVYDTDAESFEPEMNQVDIIHIQHQYFLFGGVAPWKNWFDRFIAKLTAPAVLTAHEFVPPPGDFIRRRLVSLTNKRQFLAHAIGRIIVHTDLDRQRMEASGVSGKRIEVVRHGVPPAPPLPSADESRKALGLNDEFVATIFGFISRRKGYAIAIEAMRKLPEDVILMIAGGKHPDDRGSFVDNMERLSEPCAKRVRFTGYLSEDQVAEVMSATDVVLAPFVESSGSGSLAMALACGKPIVASPIEPHLEMNNELPGVLALPHSLDPSGFAEAIITLRDHPEMMKAQSEKSLEYASKHSYGRMAEETVRVYERILAERVA